MTAAVLVLLLAGRGDEFEAALAAAPGVGARRGGAAAGRQPAGAKRAAGVAPDHSGGRWEGRATCPLSRVEHAGPGERDDTQLGVAARIAALRRSSPAVSPQVPTLIAAEFPILAIEAVLAALASFTLVAPLGIPWWLPLVLVVLIGTASAAGDISLLSARVASVEGLPAGAAEPWAKAAG